MKALLTKSGIETRPASPEHEWPRFRSRLSTASGVSAVQAFSDTRSEAVTQRNLQEFVDGSPRVQQWAALQQMADKRVSSSGGAQSGPSVVQRSLLRNVLKKATNPFVLQVKGAAPSGETVIKCWTRLVPETEKDSHSVMWFSYSGEGEERLLGKIHWTGLGFQVIYGATKDNFYKDPGSDVKTSTVAAMTTRANEHIQEAKETAPKGGLQSHCHAFVISLYGRL